MTRMDGRGERIRTSDFYLPKVALYQAELHPDTAAERCCRAGMEVAEGMRKASRA